MQDRKDHEIENPNQLQLQIWKPYSIDYVDLPLYLKTKGNTPGKNNLFRKVGTPT